MNKFALLALISILAIFQTSAQEIRDADRDKSDPERATFFLIDASGSMQRKDVESKVQEILEPLAKTNELAPVSRTYYRAEGGSACWNPIQIEPLVSASESVPRPPEEFGDNVFTPSGEALKAALLAAVARGGNSDIFIISDEDPTPGCGIDICTVAASYLPISGVRVQSIQVDGNAPARRDTMGCIEAFQSNRAIEGAHSIAQGEETTQKPGYVSFVEQWIWLIGFMIIYILSFGFGWANQSQAIKREAEADDIRSLERASLVQGNSEAKEALTDKLNEIREARDNHAKKLAAREKWQVQFDFVRALIARRIPPWQISSSLAVFGFLFWIASTDDASLFSIFNVEKMRTSAWSVLNTDFATAFAVIWIVSLFYSGIQVQRKKEAEAKYSIVSREAEWTEEAKRQQALEEANRKLSQNYNSKRRLVSALKFGAWGSYVSKAELEIDENEFELKYRFQAIQTEAKRLAVSTPDLDSLDYATEIARLDQYLTVPEISASRSYSKKFDFHKFVELMLSDGSISSGLSNNWRMLIEAIQEDDFHSFTLTLTALDLEIS